MLVSHVKDMDVPGKTRLGVWLAGTLLQCLIPRVCLAADLVCHLLYHHNVDLYSSILPFVTQLYPRLYLQCLPFKARYQQYLSENRVHSSRQ
jgi:hypothetical protein